MRRTLFLLALGSLAIGGCAKKPEFLAPKDLRQVEATCRMDADRAFASVTDTRFSQIEDYVTTCMRARGYEWNTDDPTCAAGQRSLAEEGLCYRPLSPPPTAIANPSGATAARELRLSPMAGPKTN